MVEIAKQHSERLAEIKEKVEDSCMYFDANAKRYDKFMKFVFKQSMSDEEVTAMQELGRPTLEFNILEAYVSKRRGEFAKQQPSIAVRAADGVPLSMLNQQFVETIQVMEAHLRAIFFDGSNDKLEYNVFTDLLAGGYSVMRVYTEYVNEMSMEQNINVERVFDPTLTGFDPLARKSHKGDGAYCFEIYPMTREMFTQEYGKECADQMKFTREVEGFSWSYKNGMEDIILVCDFYEKKKKRAKIVKLSNGHTVTEKEYKKFLLDWEASERIEQPPIVVGEPRWTTLTSICRYRICENEVLDYVVTDFRYLPLVFVDGNSVMIKDAGNACQMTRPYVYHAMGIQRLKNFAGQSLANELENMVQHKFIVAVESIPEDYLTAYQNIQKADTIMYNHFVDPKNTDITLPPPREVMRTPIPPQISDTFRMSDEMTQVILGSYDAARQDSNIQSGVAIQTIASESNTASIPYIIGYIKGLNRVAEIIVDLIPKYYRTPRSLPVLSPSGKRGYVQINKSGSLYMNYDPNSLQVQVETGVNFAIQKQMALQTIQGLMQSSQLFAQFMNENGLPILLDNIEIRGIDELKLKAEQFMQEQKQQAQQQQQVQQQAMQMQSQQQQMGMASQQIDLQMKQKELQDPTQAQIELMALQERSKTDAAKAAIDERKAETAFLELINKIRSDETSAEIQSAKISAEESRTAVESLISLNKHVREGEKNATEER